MAVLGWVHRISEDLFVINIVEGGRRYKTGIKSRYQQDNRRHGGRCR